jgi:hypothetical protein
MLTNQSQADSLALSNTGQSDLIESFATMNKEEKQRFLE